MRSDAAFSAFRTVGYGFVFALCVMGGVSMLAVATRRGVGLGSDSAVYLAAADNWLRGHGLSWIQGGGEATPVVIYPPVYPLTLAGLNIVGIPPCQAAGAVNLLFFGITGIAVGILAGRLTGFRVLGLVGLVLTLFCGEFISVHSWAMSEALYIGLASLGLTLVSGYLRDRRARTLIAAAIAVALASLTRYAGLSLPVVGTLALGLDDAVPRSRSLRNAAVFLLLAAAPAVMWLISTAALSEGAGGRTMGPTAALLPGLVRHSAATVLNWFLPLRLVQLLENLSPVVASLASAGAAICLLCAWLAKRGGLVRRATTTSHGEVLLPVLWTLVHSGTVLAAAVLTLPETHVSERTLSPAYPALVVALMVLAGAVWRTRRLIPRALVIAALLLLIRNKVVYAYWVVRDLAQDGQRYASTAWRTSPTVAALKRLEPPFIYTDDIAAVYLLADRYSYDIPRRLDAITGQYVESYPSDLETMRQRIAQEGAILVLFDPQHIPADMAPLEDLTQGLCPLETLADGVMYAACPSGSGD